eukprot:TRINITY_DN303_c0_g1_i1.p1 TRINITY_DN303_c0_g1~~TRINITY_DN303_c0_g1_i1.p1  ORF type:complete len:181 (+),score=30.74 TRINITY_DN303_c0_g1_i1:550-1092(+)
MDKTALTASQATVFQTTGRRKVEITGEDGASFVLSKPSFLSSKFELVGSSSSKQDRDVMLLVDKSCWKGKVTISDSKGQQLVEVERIDFWGWKFNRKFTWEGREYRWEHSSSCWKPGPITFTLVEATCKEPLARHDMKSWSWAHKGTITVFHAGGHIPRALIIATALSTEKLWRDERGTT